MMQLKVLQSMSSGMSLGHGPLYPAYADAGSSFSAPGVSSFSSASGVVMPAANFSTTWVLLLSMGGRDLDAMIG